jgi:hypothetical protein
MAWLQFQPEHDRSPMLVPSQLGSKDTGGSVTTYSGGANSTDSISTFFFIIGKEKRKGTR